MLTGQLQLNKLSNGIGSTTSSPCAAFGKSDTRLASMKLKQRALNGKPQWRRLTSKSCSPLQSRNLSNYPMEHTKEETIQTIQQKWAFNKNLAEQVRFATDESESWKKLGREKFENALNSRKGSLLPSSARSHSLHGYAGNKYCHWRYGTDHNGPTMNGSILYGQKHAVPTFCQRRPYSEPPIKHYQRNNIENMCLDGSLIEARQKFCLDYMSPSPISKVAMLNRDNMPSDEGFQLSPERKSSCVSLIRPRGGTPSADVPLISLIEEAFSEHSEDNDDEIEEVNTYDPAKPVSSLLRYVYIHHSYDI